MIFNELDEFRKDLKSLIKRYKTLDDDLNVVKKVLAIAPDERPPFSYRIDNLGLETCIIKVKKIACRSDKCSHYRDVYINGFIRIQYPT
jgi:hypothetical protein